jgi:hypothetical protein
MTTTIIIPPENLQRLANRMESDPLFGKSTSNAQFVDGGQYADTSTVGVQGGTSLFKAVNPLPALTRVLVDCVRISGDQDCSRPVELSGLAEFSVKRLDDQPEQVEYHWTKRSHRIREIARRYSETAHADY